MARSSTVDAPHLPYEGYSMGDTTTPTLLSEERIKGYAGQIFAGAKDVVRIGMPSPVPGDPGAAPVAFVARVAHVKQALSMRTDASNQMITSVAHYQEATRAISTGHDMIVSTQPDGVTGAKRALMIKILEAGWAALSTPQESVYVRLARTTKRNIEATLRRTASRRAIDIVHDLGSVTTYNVISDLFGTPGPDWLTEMAVALRFSRQHLTQIDPEWLAAIKASKPEDVGLATWQVWSILMFVDIVGNYLQQEELKALGVQAGREFLTHVDMLIVKARQQPLPPHDQPAGGLRLPGEDVHGPGQPECPAGRDLLRPGPHAAAGSRELGDRHSGDPGCGRPYGAQRRHRSAVAHPPAHEGDAVAGEVR